MMICGLHWIGLDRHWSNVDNYFKLVCQPMSMPCLMLTVSTCLGSLNFIQNFYCIRMPGLVICKLPKHKTYVNVTFDSFQALADNCVLLFVVSCSDSGGVEFPSVEVISVLGISVISDWVCRVSLGKTGRYEVKRVLMICRLLLQERLCQNPSIDSLNVFTRWSIKNNS